MACITSVSYTIQLNGQRSNSFVGGRGLKQGDALSPLLFVIAMEYMSRLMQQAVDHPEFKYHLNCSKLKLTHLIFADDLILFSKVDPKTLTSMMQVPRDFCNLARLRANMEKSQVVFGGCTTQLQ